MLSYEIIKKSKHKMSQWSGGTTTQIYIYPKDGDYATRQFDFRISCAKVTLEQSDFTPLAGFSRYIMPLEGEMHLDHAGHHSATLKPFEQDYFMGEWKTKSTGSCTDFNLMLGKGYKGSMECVKQGKATVCKNNSYTGFFIMGDGVEVCIKDGELIIATETLDNQDFIGFKPDAQKTDCTITLKGDKNTQDICAIATAIFKSKIT